MTYPTIRPELTLDFANSRQLDPRITFSRSSGATYLNPDTGLITLASDHEARFEKEGLLIEASRTNLLTYSGELDQWPVIGSNTIVTANVAVAPDGTQTADRVQNGAQTNTFIGNGAVSNGVTYTASVYAKAVTPGTNDKFTVNVGGHGNNSSQFTATSEWQRFVFTKTPTGITGGPGKFYLNNEGDGFTSDIYFWGAQLEEGDFASSLIPTAGSTVTRSTDISTIQSDNFNSWYNQGAGTITYKYTAIGGGQFLSPASIRASNAQDAQSWGYWMYTGGSQYRAPTAGQRNFPAQSIALADGNAFASTVMGQSYKAAVTHDNSTLSGCLQGYSVQSRSITSLPTMTELAIGYVKNSYNNRYTGHISRLSYYSRHLSDSELETLTL